MAAPMRNNGIKPTKFLANFWELPTSPEHFCPNSKLHFFEPNISPYQDIEEILRLFKATWYEMQQFLDFPTISIEIRHDFFSFKVSAITECV